MKMKFIVFSMLTLMVSLSAKAYTNVDGFYGETWLDHVDEDGFGGGNFGNGSESNPYQIHSAGALAFSRHFSAVFRCQDARTGEPGGVQLPAFARECPRGSIGR